jgi:CheY-like chemotaxis protein
MVTFPAPERPVLIVEDDPGLREALTSALEADGYATLTASNGAEAADLLRTGQPVCLILLDIRMPGGSGIEFLRTRRDDPAMADIPTIAYSGDGELREEVEALGVALFFRKPLPARTLLDFIDQHRLRD